MPEEDLNEYEKSVALEIDLPARGPVVDEAALARALPQRAPVRWCR